MIVQCVSHSACEYCEPFQNEPLEKPWLLQRPLEKPVIGRYYTVEDIIKAGEGAAVILKLVEHPLPHPWWHCGCNFRPVEDADDDFVKMIEEIEHRARNPEWQERPLEVA